MAERSRPMKKTSELGVAQRAISPNEVPTPQQVLARLTDLREWRSDIANVFESMSLTGVRWGELRAIRVGWLSEVPLPQLNCRTITFRPLQGERPQVLARHPTGTTLTARFGDLPPVGCGNEGRRLPVHQPAGRPALGRHRPQVPARLPPPRPPPLRRIHLAAPRHPRERGRRIPRRRRQSAHRSRRLFAHPR